MDITGPMINKMAYFEFNVNGWDFEKLFIKVGGNSHMAKHLWGKFHGYDHSFLKLFGYSDLQNRRLLVKVINIAPDYSKPSFKRN